MAQLTVRVNKLNQRKGPVTNFADKSNVVSVVNTGYTFESQGIIKNNLGTWHSDADGYYYWEEGLEESDAVGVLDYNLKSPLAAEVRNTKGENVTVGIVDTGCFIHSALSKVKISGRNFVDENTNYEDVSTKGHGTFVAGIIAARPTTGNSMKGVAENASLIVAKITAQKGIADRTPILNGLKWLVSQKPDIINCSFDFSPNDDLEEFTKIFSSQEAEGIIWVAAGQDGKGLLLDIIYYPAADANFVPVGAVNNATLNDSEIGLINPLIKYIISDSTFISTDKFDTYSDDIGSSFASALVTGNLALIKSYLTQKGVQNTPKDCIDFLDKNIGVLNAEIQLKSSFTILKR
jgi:subtilisin family serine protease